MIPKVAASEIGTAQTSLRKRAGVVGRAFRKRTVVEWAGRPVHRE